MTDDRRMTGANVATGTAVVVPSRAGDRRRRARAARALLVAAGANVGVVLALALARAPVDLPQPGGLALWLDASAGSTITLSGSDITQWNDKSGNANHAARA